VVCGQGQKNCSNECVAPSVSNGCAPDLCEPCPPPKAANDAEVEHIEVWCNSQQNCDVRCVAGYVPSAGRCVPEGTVGTGGSGGGGGTGGTSGGTGGTPGGTGGGGNAGTAGSGATSGTSGSGGTGGGGRCSPNSCPPCPAPDGKFPCCTLSGRCGCGYPVVGYFYCI
jgi:hypothetical protein